jgi:hypothetical protein
MGAAARLGSSILLFLQADGWTPPPVLLSPNAPHPRVACTAVEISRLREAWASKSPAREPVAARVARADAAIKTEPVFPPRGGQHNTWYQCRKCQLGLGRIDGTHHECPSCRTVYTGEPYDDVVFGDIHNRNLDAMVETAWAWAVTRDGKYADFATRILKGYAERYEGYEYHDSSLKKGKAANWTGGRLFEQTLNEAAAMARQIAPAFDLVHDALSPEDRAKVADGLVRPMLRNIAKNPAGKSNWQTWHNAGMLWGGAVLGEASWIEKAVADPANGFARQMKVSVTSDGMWYENSWGYHFYTLSAMTHLAEGARRLGIDLWGHPSLRKMYTLAPRYAMADGSLPRFGDDVNSSAGRGSGMMEAAWAATKDPAVLALLGPRPSWESVLLGRDPAAASAAPPLASEVFPGAGHAILRSRGEAGLTAAVTFGPYGGFHGHLDKLSFVFFGHGRELGVDPGRARSQAYRLPIHTHWYKSTLSHNAVTADGHPQKPASGKLLRFSANADWAAVLARCDEAYADTRHDRLLVLGPEYLVVVDRLKGTFEQRYDWFYHSRGTAARSEAAADPGGTPPPCDGWDYTKDVKSGKTDGPFAVEFDDGPVVTTLRMAGAPGTGVATATGPGASVLERVPLVRVTRAGREVSFAAVIEPAKKGRKGRVRSVRLPEPGTVAVETESEKVTVTFSEDLPVRVTAGAVRLLE